MDLATSASFSLASLVAPGLRLLTGPRSLARAGFAWVLAHLPPPAPLVVVDGGVHVDSYLLTEVAGHLGEAPRALTDRVHLARAFTPPQFVALVEAAAADVVREAGAHALLLAPFDPFAREAAAPREAWGFVARLLRALERLARPPRSTVVVCPDLPGAGGLRAAFVERAAPLAAAHHRFGVDQVVEGDACQRAASVGASARDGQSLT